MRICGVDRLVFGVEDLPASVKCCEDFGLILADGSNDRAAILEARDGSSLELRHKDDPVLPHTDVEGSTLRAIVWGVEDEKAIDEIEAELAKDRETSRDTSGRLLSRDDADNGLVFQVAIPRRPIADLPAANVPGHFQRGASQRVELEKEIRPRGIAHVVLNCADEPTARAFYIKRLGFVVTDSFSGTGAFLRTATSDLHHAMFTVKKPANGFNHAAFYVTDFHEVVLGGRQMTRAGWKSYWGPGRHRLGSNYFWYFQAPLGGNLEYTCDVDQVDENWVPMELEFTRENSALWSADGIIPAV
jgi:catechol 2,3-dioxygenase-like lactoylglutathione lyase family enzyme